MRPRLVTKISIANGILLVLMTLSEYAGWIKYTLLFSYELHKMLHIVGVTLFMGNMIVGPVWFSYAFFSKNLDILRFSGKMLELTDIIFTIPGLFLTVLNGLFLASAFGGSRNMPWLFYSVILLLLMWLLSIPLILIQERMYKAIAEEPENRKKLSSLLVLWSIVGTVVMIPPAIIFYLMIVKSM